MTVWHIVLRRGSVILLLAWLMVFVGVLMQRQIASRAQREGGTLDIRPEPPGERPVRIQKGVEFNQTYGPDLSFRIAASEGAEYESGWAELSGVQVSFYSEGEVAYGLTAERGRFHIVHKEAHTVGETLLSLRGGIAARAAGFTYDGTALELRSEGPVALAGQGWGGVAEEARALVRDDVLELAGGVSLSFRRERGVAPVVLLAPRVRYERKRALVVFPDGVELLYQRLSARASGARLLLASEEGEPRRLDLDEPVLVQGELPDGSPVEAVAGRCVVERVEGGRIQLSAQAMAIPGWVRVRWLDASAGWQQLDAWRVVGEGTETAWEWLEGQGQSCGFQVDVPEVGSRRIEAERLRLVFEDGRARSAVASAGVLVESGERWLRGGNLEASLASRAFTMAPALRQRVSFGAPEIEGWCDRMEGAADGTVVASGQAGGIFRRANATVSDDPPTRFAAQTATLPPGGQSLTLEGDARVWQQDRLIRAQRLVYQVASEELQGEGQVLTRAPLSGGERPGELTVRARRLLMRRAAGEALYEGEVEAADSRGTASCGKLLVRMDESGRVRNVELDSGVKLMELQTGRVLTGQRGLLDVGEDLFEMWGSPVIVREADGNQITGNRLVWRRRTGNIVVTGGEDTPSETLYHPAQRTAVPTPARRQPSPR